MSRSLHLAYIIVALFLFTSTRIADATLLATSNANVIYDDITQTYWISDLTLLSNLTYEEQLERVNDWNTNGTFSSENWGNFRIASLLELGQTFYHNYEYSFGEYEHLFTSNWEDRFRGRSSSQYNASIAPDMHQEIWIDWWSDEDWMYYNDAIEIHDSVRSSSLGAWVIADSVNNPVPEPASIILLSCGVMSLLVRKRIKCSHR